MLFFLPNQSTSDSPIWYLRGGGGGFLVLPVFFPGFPPTKSENFTPIFFLFNQMFLSEGGHFFDVDMHFRATFFACQGQKKMAIFFFKC